MFKKSHTNEDKDSDIKLPVSLKRNLMLMNQLKKKENNQKPKAVSFNEEVKKEPEEFIPKNKKKS